MGHKSMTVLRRNIRQGNLLNENAGVPDIQVVEEHCDPLLRAIQDLSDVAGMATTRSPVDRLESSYPSTLTRAALATSGRRAMPLHREGCSKRVGQRTASIPRISSVS